MIHGSVRVNNERFAFAGVTIGAVVQRAAQLENK